MMRKWLFSVGIAGAFAAWAGCSADTGKVFQGEGGSGGDGNTSSGTTSSGTTSSGTGGGGGCFLNCGSTSTSTSTGSGGPQCNTDPALDDDQDGFSENNGDCNDCDANVSPGAIEVFADPNDPNAQPADEDCDGQVDNVAPTCDDNIPLDNFEPMNGARAIDLCQQATGNKWGVISANYVRADGSPAPPSVQVGIMNNFGPNVNPQGGKQMLVLSSGTARTPGQPGACGANTCAGYGAGTPPSGFPQDIPGCSGQSNINDDVGLEIRVKSPKNATGYKFNSKFYSFEYPEWVCTSFNDQMIALVTPPPMGAINGNILFDNNGNPVTVNFATGFTVCSGCANGTGELDGTGFEGNWGDDAGATVWLGTQAPITGGEEITIRFAVWDTGDSAWDSTTLIDNFQWIANGGTVVIGTDPIDNPK